MADESDPYRLSRFIQAQDRRCEECRERPYCRERTQDRCYEQALSEVKSGHKVNHWMWYTFPQFEGLGSSENCRTYSIKSVREAEAYLEHPILGPRLAACMQAVLDATNRSAIDIFGPTDAKKLRSCATLFAWASPLEGSVFQQVLETCFAGKPDRTTLRLSGIRREGWNRKIAGRIKMRASSSGASRRECHPPDPRAPWRGPAAPVFRYFDDWASAVLECPCCGWHGTFWEGDMEPFEQVFDSCCPRCTCQRSNRMLAVVAHATLEECETEGNLQKLPPEERKDFEAWVDRVHRWEAMRLKSPSQLPELAREGPMLTWDFEDSGAEKYTVIRQGDAELWRELAVYGGGERFKEIAEIVSARYGNRVVDMVPSPASEMYLYDDSWRAPDLVEEARRLLRGSGS